MKLQKSNERLLALIKSSLDIVVAVGLLQLAPKKVTPRVTGAFGFTSSLIACYQVSYLIPNPFSLTRAAVNPQKLNRSLFPWQLLPAPAKSK